MVVGADLCLLSSDDFDENRISGNDERGFSLDFNVDMRPHEEEDTEEEEEEKEELYALHLNNFTLSLIHI